MRRKLATALIDELRVLAAERGATASPDNGLQALLDKYRVARLAPCGGEAHSNAYIDNCSLCSPRWGWVGPVEVVS